jgi:hypothetical protein
VPTIQTGYWTTPSNLSLNIFTQDCFWIYTIGLIKMHGKYIGKESLLLLSVHNDFVMEFVEYNPY